MAVWTWVPPPTATDPAVARMYMAVNYDVANAYTLMFGGLHENGLATENAETWTWDGVALAWTQRFPAHAPQKRFFCKSAYLGATGLSYLLGGANAAGTYYLDMWSWNGTDWTQVTTATYPATSAWYPNCLTWDQTNDVLVLFKPVFAGPNETWTFDGTDWTQQFPANMPAAPFTVGSTCWDVANGYVLLTGTPTFPASTDLIETWSWDGTDWTQITTATAPRNRGAVMMDYAPGYGSVVLAGGVGRNPNGSCYSDSWSWDGATWTNVSVAFGGIPLISSTLIGDPVNNISMWYGGYKCSPFAWGLTTLLQDAPDAPVGPVFSHSLRLYDE